MAIQVTSQEYHGGEGLTWDDTGLPLSKREGQAWWAGWDEGRKDGQIDMQEEMADEIERLREALRDVSKIKCEICCQYGRLHDKARTALGGEE